jgi:hypothetical protein
MDCSSHGKPFAPFALIDGDKAQVLFDPLVCLF